MPALVAFGRRWQVATDDFVFPGFIDVLIRVSWLIAGCIVYWKEEAKLSCPGGHFMKNYLMGNFVILLLIVFSDLVLVQNSMNGFIMDAKARRHVPLCLYFRWILEVPQLGWNILGTLWVYSEDVVCLEAPETLFLIKTLVILSWLLFFINLVFIALAFDPLGGSKKSFDDVDYDRFNEGVLYGKNSRTQLWEKRCRFLMCSCCGNDEVHRNAFKDVGKMMAFLFDDVDLVPTDIAAGLIVMNLKGQVESSSLENQVLNPPASGSLVESVIDQPGSSMAFNFDSGPEWSSPETVCYFMKYALGSYGWPWFLLANPRSGLFRLWENLLCCGCCCCITHPCSVEGDNWCYCNTSALRQTTAVEEKDLWYASFANSVFQTPFYVAIDHSKRAVVIAIRGTLSLRDAITDLAAEAKSLSSEDLPAGCKAHYGMTLAAQNILKKLDETQVLIKAEREHPEYTVVLAGHSLGAGAATILSFLLHSRYPNLKCYAYSPPGGLLSLEAAEFSKQFAVSVVVGDDIVARLSVPTFEKFKSKLVQSIKDCKIPKYRILVGGCWYLIMGGIPSSIMHPVVNDSNKADGHSDSSLLQADHEPTNYHTYVSLAEVSHRLQRESVTNCPMYLPGKIMHITARPIFHSRPDLMEGSRYEFRWVSHQEFSEIKVTPTMLMDHQPDNVFRAMQDIVAGSSFERPNFSVT